MKLFLIFHLLISFSLSVAFDPKISFSDFKHHPEGLLYFKDSSVILYHSSDGTLRRSDNDGQSWSDVKLDGIKEGGIEFLIEHPFDNKIAYALTKAADNHYLSKDQGKSWTSFKMQSINRFAGNRPLSFHKKNPNYVIVSGAECPDGNKHSPQCVDKSIYTTDNFANGNKGNSLGDKSFRCIWAHSSEDSDDSIPQDTIVCLLETDGTRKLAMSSDFFRSNEYIKVDGKELDNVLDFGTMSKYFVAAVDPDYKPGPGKSKGTIKLLTSVDLTKWSVASFPDDGKSTINHASAFTVLESSKHSLHIDVAFDVKDEGTLYTSNSNGNYFTKSLDHTSRNSRGLVDIENVEGIDGILISNVKEGHNIRTKISYDDGRSWKYLTINNCKSGSGVYDCNVNLHAILDHRNVGRIFSSPAPGILAGIGNTGIKLESRSKGDFYISHDSGLTWIKAYNGPHFYEFADQGNIILAVEDKLEVDELKYSLDRGITWSIFKLNDKIHPQFLLTTPDSTSMKFLIMANRIKDKKPVTVAINFDGLYSNKCIMKDDGSGDFEKWYARYGSDSKPTCILGHKQYFWRKKIDSKCYVGDLYHEQFASKEDCPCTEYDYECDERFILNPEGKCTPTKEYLLELLQCKEGESYERSTGYALVPGNTCIKENGVTLDGKKTVVCGSESNDGGDKGDKGGDNKDNDKDKADGKVKSHSHLFNGEIINYFYLPIDKDFPGQETIIVQNNYDQGFITHDQGSTWENLFDGKEILSVISNPHFPNALYVLTFDSKLHVSTDRGHTFTDMRLPANPAVQASISLDFHPKHIDWLIYIGEQGCDNPFSCKLGGYYTTDGGKSWELLQDDVTRCSWVGNLLHQTDEKLIFCDRLVPQSFGISKALISSKDFFKTKKTHFESVVGYAFQSEFIVVATIDEKKSELKAYVSVDGDTFAHAEFPPNFKVDHQQAYTVLESVTNAIFLHITVSDRPRAEYGSILKSNSNGTDYVLSLEGVNRNEIGYVDFEKMRGLEGVALANVVANLDEAKSGIRKKLKSKITHNDGAIWSYIKPPERDSNGDKYECTGKSLNECSLNLHGYTERDDYRDTYSSDSAVGLMIAVGNVGEFLTDKKDGNTYLTRDGGITWKEIKKGAYMWDFGDSGSIISIVNGHDSTNTMYYSLNEGASWNEYKFSDDLVKVDDITTVPSDTSRKFVLLGRPPAKEGAKSFAIQVDFTGLTDRKCILDSGDSNKDDFELWSPSHPFLKEACLFGHEALYHRKIPDRNCYIGWTPDMDILKPHKIIRNCTCSREDFECDFNYYYANDGTCQLVPGYSPPDHKAVCNEMPGTVEYWEPTGYRRIPMTTCDGGSEFDKTISHPCPGQEDRYDRKHGRLSGIGLFVVIMLPIGMALVVGYIVWDHFQKRYGQIRLGEEDDDQPVIIKYLVISIAAVIAVVSVIPTLAKSVYERILSKVSNRDSLRYTTRSSFRSSQRYSPVDIEEDGELLAGDGEDDDLDDELDQEL